MGLTRQLVWLDLCSGLGGASQPALDRGWKVIRVDIDPRFKPDIVADVRALPLRPFHVDVLWASPPCTEFSKHGLRCFYPNPAPPDLGIAQAVRELIGTLCPAVWFVENVWAARPFLTGIFGPVRAQLPGHAIWSNTLVLFPQVAPHKSQSVALTARGVGAIPAKRGDFRKMYRGSPERHCVGNRRIKNAASFIPNVKNAAAQAAVIPYEIGEAICRAVESRQR